MNGLDFKVASVDSLISALSSEGIDKDKFSQEVINTIKTSGVSNNQYTFLLDVLYKTIRGQYHSEKTYKNL